MGCGWLGYPLARILLQEGFVLRGTSTTLAKLDLLQNKGIEAFRIALHEKQISGPIDEFLHGLDILIVNIPPGMRNSLSESYFKKIELLYHHIRENNVGKIVFVSSTSVYGNAVGPVSEETQVEPVTNSAKHLVKSEQLFFEDDQLETSVVRFGGLIGPDRHPVTMLSGKTGLKNGNEAVNLIHLNDCINLIKSIILNDWWHEIFNGVYPDHPTKADYYVHEARFRRLEIPHYETTIMNRSGKIIESKNFLIKNGHFYTPIRS